MKFTAEFLSELHSLINTENAYYRCMVITPDGVNANKVPYSFRELFPALTPIAYEGNLLFVQPMEKRMDTLPESLQEELSALLKEHHCFLGLSRVDRHEQSIASHFLTALSAIRLGRLLDSKGKQVLFYYADYSTFYLIDLAAKEFLNEHQGGDLVLLTHPSIIHLARYDIKHHTNLQEVVFQYLICDRSVSQAAKKLYMHRNTVLNKLNKIAEITEVSMNDEVTRHQLILSCLILRYYQNVLHEEPKL